MPVIDADSHVDETEATWKFMSESEQRYRPTTVCPPDIHPIHVKGGNGRFWNIDGQLKLRRYRDDPNTGEVFQETGGTTEATRELIDAPARLRHMDAIGVDIQVMYPTLFLEGITLKPEVERAVTNAYNRWLADRTADSGGRLRWLVVPSLLDMPNALEQLRFGKEHGACGVFMKGQGAADERLVVDQYFDPLYATASDLDMPLCFHSGRNTPHPLGEKRFCTEPVVMANAEAFMRNTLPVLYAFHSLVQFKIPERFPALRCGFIEANSSWVPYVVYDLGRKGRKLVGDSQPVYDHSGNNLVARNRLYVTCYGDEDLATIIRTTGEDNLVVGTDYSHPDAAYDLQVVSALRQRARSDETIAPRLIEKILDDNPRKLYGI